MKITCVMVSSLDGKTTKGNNPNPTAWNSKEDQIHFQKCISDAKLIVMGRKTYEVIKSYFQHVDGRLRLVVTHSPEKFVSESKPGLLEFTNEDPKALVKRLTEKGYEEMLLVGGSNLNASFFNEGLITDLLLTIEPKILGEGSPLTGTISKDIKLNLNESKKLNPQGTLLLHYKISQL